MILWVFTNDPKKTPLYFGKPKTNETNTNKLLDSEFKIMVTQMLSKLGRKMDKHLECQQRDGKR